jgi:predicted ATPase
VDKVSYIKSISTKNFKSIKDSTVELSPGINILIGKNASGKSIFFESIQEISRVNKVASRIGYRFSSSEITYITEGKNIITLSASRNSVRELKQDKSDKNDGDLLNLNIKINNKSVPLEKKSNLRSIRRTIYADYKIDISLPKYVQFNLPTDLTFVSTPGNLQFTKDDESDSYFNFELINGRLATDMIHNLELEIESNTRKHTKSSVSKLLVFDKRIKNQLKKYSPIADIRFSPNINLYKAPKHLKIENLYIEFKVDNSWMPWSYLSDGTKRLFYLIYELVNSNSSCILIEEPELGIHPHQYHKILDFLKEESENKQIIISTHSPQTLNIIPNDELNRIIISKYDSKTGSTYRHLTKAEIAKANKYRKEVGFLSDYWLHSDLEK